MRKGTEIAVQYKLPENWNNETAYSFDHLSELVEQVHNSAYSSAVKAINRYATIRNYIIGYGKKCDSVAPIGRRKKSDNVGRICDFCDSVA